MPTPSPGTPASPNKLQPATTSRCPSHSAAAPTPLAGAPSQGPDSSCPMARSPPVGTRGPLQGLNLIWGGRGDPAGEILLVWKNMWSFCLFLPNICQSQVSNILAGHGPNPALFDAILFQYPLCTIIGSWGVVFYLLDRIIDFLEGKKLEN